MRSSAEICGSAARSGTIVSLPLLGLFRLPKERMREAEIDTIEQAPSQSAPGGNVSAAVRDQLSSSARRCGPLPYRDIRRSTPRGQKETILGAGYALLDATWLCRVICP